MLARPDHLHTYQEIQMSEPKLKRVVDPTNGLVSFVEVVEAAPGVEAKAAVEAPAAKASDKK